MNKPDKFVTVIGTIGLIMFGTLIAAFVCMAAGVEGFVC